MNKDKLNLLHLLLGELEIHLKIKLDLGKKAGGTQGHKWGHRYQGVKQAATIVKNMLTESRFQP